MVEQFPTPEGPAAAMVFVGTVIFAATAAMYWLSGPSDEATQSALQEPNPIAVEERKASDMPAGDGETRISLEQPAFEVTAASEREETAPGVRPALQADEPVEIRPVLPTASEIASVLATDDNTQETVEVAETVEELLALEEAQRREVEADLAATSFETTSAVRIDAGSKVSATVTTWVNMRAGPSDDASVLMIVPGSAEIEAETGCNWCAVSYDGREGYIYKNFINYR